MRKSFVFECWGANSGPLLKFGNGNAGKVAINLFCPDHDLCLIVPNEMRATFVADMRQLAAKLEATAS